MNIFKIDDDTTIAYEIKDIKICRRGEYSIDHVCFTIKHLSTDCWCSFAAPVEITANWHFKFEKLTPASLCLARDLLRTETDKWEVPKAICERFLLQIYKEVEKLLHTTKEYRK